MTDNQEPFVLGFGEVLWDMLPQGRQCGGAPANVIYHLQKNGIAGAIVSAVGQDADGNDLLDFLHRKGITADYVSRNALPTGKVNVTLKNGIPEYDICRPAAWDAIVLPPHLEQKLGSVSAVVFGTLAQRGETSRQTLQKLLSALPPSCLRIFDINLRQNYYTLEIIQDSLKHADILKINDEELESIGQLFHLECSGEECMKRLFPEYNLKYILLTLGARGSMLYDGRHFSAFPVLPCKVLDTIGCGDAFLAGWLGAMLQGKTAEEAMHCGTRLSAFVAEHAGAMP